MLHPLVFDGYGSYMPLIQTSKLLPHLLHYRLLQ